jgi:mRNA interferase MazF
MIVLRGDIVLVAFPFTTGAATKIRPAVVVQTGRNNRRLRSTILAAITSNLRNASEATQVSIDISSPDGKLTGLLQASAIKCEHLATVEMDLILRRIGRLSDALLAEMASALRSALDL